MESISLNFIRKASLIVALSCAHTAHGQIGEWIADQIRAEIQSQISSVTNYNSNYLGPFGGYIWESVVGAYSESEMEDKMKQLKDINIDKSSLLRLSQKYPGYNQYWTSYSELTPLLAEKTNSYFHTMQNATLKDIAGKKIATYATAYIDSISLSSKIDNVTSILNRAALDSLNIFNDQRLNDSILKDLGNNRSIAVLLNMHPEAMRVYYNTLDVPQLRQHIQHLYYWAVSADSHKDRLSKKQKLINPRRLSFVSKARSIEILDGNKVVAKMEQDNVYVYDVNIMNLIGRPSTTYIFENNQWITDSHGRVVTAQQFCNKGNKKKCKQKSHLKAKKFKTALGVDKAYKLGYFNQLEYGAPDVLLNSYFYANSKENKTEAKKVKKERNTKVKKLGVCNMITYATYCDPGKIPSKIDISTAQIVNPGLHAVSQNRTLPDTMRFNPSKKIAITYKTDVLKSSYNRDIKDEVYINSHSITKKKNSSPQPTSLTWTRDVNTFNGIYTLKGKIDGKFAVTMYITLKDGDISGTYYYDKYRRAMKIGGTVSADGQMILTEYEGSKSTGKYDGIFDGKVFKGTFISYNNYRELPVNLVVE